MPGDDDAGAFHSSELWYVFGTLDRCWRPMTEADYQLSRIISNYWANFAKTGNPNAEGLPEWSPCLAGTPTELTLGQRMLNHPVNLDQE